MSTPKSRYYEYKGNSRVQLFATAEDVWEKYPDMADRRVMPEGQTHIMLPNGNVMSTIADCNKAHAFAKSMTAAQEAKEDNKLVRAYHPSTGEWMADYPNVRAASYMTKRSVTDILENIEKYSGKDRITGRGKKPNALYKYIEQEVA